MEKIENANIKSFCEFFAGVGLVHEGLQGSGWKCVYANDIDDKKRQMYEGHFGKSNYYHVEDVWETASVTAKIEDSPFLATASFPCIDLSLAGHWRGFAGAHSSTYFGFLEVLRALGKRRPKVVMLENVYGFLTSNDGEDFAKAVRSLAELGYWIDAIMLDAKWFVPQSRPRVFVFGFDKSVTSGLAVQSRQNFMEHSAWRDAIESSAELRPLPIRRAFEKLELPTGWATNLARIPDQVEYSLGDLIDTDDAQDWWDKKSTLKHYVMMEPPSRNRVDAILSKGGTAVGAAFRRTRRGLTRTEVRFDLAGCLRTPKGGSAKQIIIAIVNGKLRMRWMSAREYARLQGAGAYRIAVPPTQAMYGFGDAVCVPAISWIDENILSPIFLSAKLEQAAA